MSEIFVDGKNINFKKYKGYEARPINGAVSAQNIKLANGKLTLNPEGAKQLWEGYNNIHKIEK
ncbi:hypothetical protein [Bacillus sp. SRB3LM]|uniref:hypothetical protein n=1 Tax=Bacillus sp. SRB3LM TaxID=2608689 RepID=UPI0018C3B336|nr:hypothetical protein [Bacillus sp. SRB3LM]MBG0970633.1 hypothetical protein [Bacillus sp. SRB3LM]